MKCNKYKKYIIENLPASCHGFILFVFHFVFEMGNQRCDILMRVVSGNKDTNMIRCIYDAAHQKGNLQQ